MFINNHAAFLFSCELCFRLLVLGIKLALLSRAQFGSEHVSSFESMHTPSNFAVVVILGKSLKMHLKMSMQGYVLQNNDLEQKLDIDKCLP